MIFPTWTPDIDGENSIRELRKIEVNDTRLEIMIRSEDKENPVILIGHSYGTYIGTLVAAQAPELYTATERKYWIWAVEKEDIRESLPKEKHSLCRLIARQKQSNMRKDWQKKKQV